MQSLDDRSASPPPTIIEADDDDDDDDDEEEDADGDANVTRSRTRQAKCASTVIRAAAANFPVVPTREPSPKSIPADFSVGDAVMVAKTHARHPGRIGTVRRHTAKFVVIAFDDDLDATEGIRISPTFLARTSPRPRFLGRLEMTSPSSSPVDSKRSFVVSFDLGRNSMAEYDGEAPPSIVSERTYLPGNAHPHPNVVEHTPDEIDDVTLRNEEILAEWDDHFDEDYNFDERYNNVFFRLVSL